MHMEIVGANVAGLAVTYNFMVDAKRNIISGYNSSSGSTNVINSGAIGKVACM